MTEQETHQGPGVYGGWETHRGARHACPAPDCGPDPDAAEALARVRAFVEDMRDWCSPRGVAKEYADRILAVMDGEDGR